MAITSPAASSVRPLDGAMAKVSSNVTEFARNISTTSKNKLRASSHTRPSLINRNAVASQQDRVAGQSRHQRAVVQGRCGRIERSAQAVKHQRRADRIERIIRIQEPHESVPSSGWLRFGPRRIYRIWLRTFHGIFRFFCSSECELTTPSSRKNQSAEQARPVNFAKKICN